MEGGRMDVRMKGVLSRYFSSSSDGYFQNHAIALVVLLCGLGHVLSRWSARVSGTISGP